MKTVLFAALAFIAVCSALHAEDMEALSNRFYSGLAKVIEANMDDPDRCLMEVDYYYKEHSDDVQKIRESIKKGMAMVASKMGEYQEKYSNMTEEELDALEKQSAGHEPDMSPEMEHYNKVVGEFTVRYPKHAMELAMKMMQMMPDAEDMGQMMQQQYR